MAAAAAVLAINAVLVVVLGVVIGSARVAGKAAALTTDDAGNLHVSVPDPSNRVFINGVDILAAIDDLDEQLQRLLATTTAPPTTTPAPATPRAPADLAQSFDDNSLGTNARFGAVVAEYGNVLAVGVPGAGAGAVYMYARGTVTEPFVASTQLSNPDSTADFGEVLALHGDVLAVGAPDQNSATGAVHVFSKDGDGSWSFAQTLTGGESGAVFGNALALNFYDGNYILVVGEPRKDVNGVTDAGTVTVYSGATASTLVLRQRLQYSQTASHINFIDNFGSSVSVNGAGWIAVGAPFTDEATAGVQNPLQHDNGLTGSGSVVVFAPTEVQHVWALDVYLKPTPNVGNARFGWHVALDDSNQLVATAPHPSAGATPRAFVFQRSSTDASWSQTAVLEAPIETGLDYSEGYGEGGLAISDALLVVGAPELNDAGAVFVYERNATQQWTSTEVIVGNNQTGSTFGKSAVLTAGAKQVVIGSPRYAIASFGNGDVFTFSL